MTYQFGREVTIKLPEPKQSADDGSWVEWVTDEHSSVSSRDGGVVTLATTGALGLMGLNMNYKHARSIAAQLLAAADYAENGDQT